MSEEVATPLAVFGDPEAGQWALIIGGRQPRLALASIAASDGASDPLWQDVSLDNDDGDVWLASGSGIDLKIEMAGASSYTYEDGSALRPCRLSGTVAADRSGELDIPGVLLADLPNNKFDSTRIFSSWFPTGHEISLLSIRPIGAKGHDGDHVDVVARGEEGSIVFDPRLSTTYGPGGHPRKAGIELWLGDDDDGEQHPCRVSGVASGAHLTHAAGSVSVDAYALHCLSRGDTGTGVYVLIRP